MNAKEGVDLPSLTVNYPGYVERSNLQIPRDSLWVREAEANQVLNGRSLVVLRRLFLTLFVGSIALWVARPLGIIACIGLALYALRGSRQSVEALGLLALLLLGNKAIYPGEVTLFRWVILFAACGRVAWDSMFGSYNSKEVLPLLLPLGLLATWSLLGAAVVSALPWLSVLKTTSFIVGVFTILISFHRTAHLVPYWRSWFFTLFLFILVGSVLAYPLGLGYLRTQHGGFQGIMQHPMTLGPIVASVGAWLGGSFLMSSKSTSPWVSGGAATVAVLLTYLSLSRTAALVLGAGFLLALASMVFSRGGASSWGNLLNQKVTLLLLALLCAVVAFAPQLQQATIDFVNKDGAEFQGTSELFQESRGALVQKSIDNYKKSPIIGVGFGIPSDLSRVGRQLETVGGIPVSVSSEKGFMPTAILEEVGTFGFVLVIWFLFILMKYVLQWGSFEVVWLLWASLLVNVGQAIFFSIGGPGFFMWLMIGFCFAQAIWERRKHQQ